MDSLVKLVSEKAGISESQAQQAVDTVLGHLRQQLPAPMAAQLDNLLADGTGVDQAGNLAQGLGGFFGKK